MLPNSELAVVPGASHIGPFMAERASIFTTLIGDFAERQQRDETLRRNEMLSETSAYSGIAVRDMADARRFYADTLGVRTSEEYGLMWLHHANDRRTLIYEQPSAEPASYTVLNFEVPAIDAAVDGLVERGVEFERFEGFEQDERGVFREEGPFIAWFKDPSGNMLSVLQER
jgi:catechol 2,3-dioxygenase-like lactoylglutathione lyase family enzyme